MPAERRICTTCDDSLDETFVRPFWQFFFRVEDTKGTPLELLIDSPDVSTNLEFSECSWPDFSLVKQCTVLDGLEPSDLHEDEETLEQLRERLAPVMGNLEEAHDAMEDRTEVPEPDGPMLDLLIASCPVDDDGTRVYVLLQHNIQS